MLSFFSKKKPSSDSSPEDAIQGPVDPQQQNVGDDFIFVEKKTPEDPAKPQTMYPPMPAPFGMGGGLPYPGASFPFTSSGGGAVGPVPYVQGIPFELAPQLCTKSIFEVTQLQVDGILAVMTRQMSVEEQDEYNFTVERSVQNECY